VVAIRLLERRTTPAAFTLTPHNLDEFDQAKGYVMPVISGLGALVEVPWERVTDKIERRVAGQQGMIVWWKMKAGPPGLAGAFRLWDCLPSCYWLAKVPQPQGQRAQRV
jgi:hypothetical protein